MDKLRRSFRDSFRNKKKDPNIPESAKPRTWIIDESSVRAGTCSFNVKYLGCVEVFESRGMQVCEEALKVLRNSRRRPLRGVLYVSGDGLRVVDDETKGLLVDQTIEKVSFCAPDRNHERGFSYICRDGTTRRWMCHGFIAVKDSGERLSHAVGCAFAACLERKQKRDKECGVTMTFDQTTSTFTRMGSFRQMSLTERLSDPQECKPTDNPIPVKKVENPHAIARPHATPQLLQRQGSFKVFNQLNQSSPFKRQLSLRLNDLPSNLERTRSLPLDNDAPSSLIENSNNIINNNNGHQQDVQIDPPFSLSLSSPTSEDASVHAIPPRSQRNRLQSLPNTVNMAPIPESSPLVEHRADAVSAMCQQVSAGLSLLSNFPDPFSSSLATGTTNSPPTSSVENSIFNAPPLFGRQATTPPVPASTSQDQVPENPLDEGINWNLSGNNMEGSAYNNAGLSKGEEWLAQFSMSSFSSAENAPNDFNSKQIISSTKKTPPLSQLRSASLGAAPSSPTPSLNIPPRGATLQDPPFQNVTNGFNSSVTTTSSGSGAFSSARPVHSDPPSTFSTTKSVQNDPFDADWVSIPRPNPNNPFLSNTTHKAFEVQM